MLRALAVARLAKHWFARAPNASTRQLGLLSSAVANLVAAHSTLDVPVLSIEGARTYAPSIGTGALAILRAV